ncbi:MAG: D-alanyl-D-alanine carboxypeptidase [Xanthomonadales bacterium]|nr:D-alanyl-D-alanine carboxypeptidase [Xanthomonadales bacterium]
MRLMVLLFCLCSAAFAQTPVLPQPAAPQAAPAPLPPAPEFPVKSTILVDYITGQVLAGQNPDERAEPASITKVMAAYVVFTELGAGRLTLDEKVRISQNAWERGLGGSRMFAKVGSEVSVEELLLGVIVQSGNDATVALAEHIAGSEEAFAAMMNAQAKRLGLTGTHFTNAPGLPNEEHYSTARDIAMLARAMIADFPQYYAWYSMREFTFNGIRQYNRNALLGRDDTVDGIKTGHTQSAGYCLLSSAKRGDARLIAVVLGSASEEARAQQSQALLNYGFRFFETHRLYLAGQALSQVQLWKGELEQLDVGLAEPLDLVVPRASYDRLEASMDLPRYLVAPLAKGQVVGKLRVKLDGKDLAERDLLLLEEAVEGGWWSRTYDGFWLWFEDDA